MMPTDLAMAAGDHDNLDTSRTALGDGVGDGSAGRVNHGHEADKAEALNGEVAVVGVEGIAAGIFVQGEDEVAEAQHTLTQPAQLHVGRVEGVLPLLQDLDNRNLRSSKQFFRYIGIH